MQPLSNKMFPWAVSCKSRLAQSVELALPFFSASLGKDNLTVSLHFNSDFPGSGASSIHLSLGLRVTAAISHSNLEVLVPDNH